MVQLEPVRLINQSEHKHTVISAEDSSSMGVSIGESVELHSFLKDKTQ